MEGQLKRLNLNEPSFTANGKTYYIEQALSIERYCEFTILEKELGYGMNFETMLKKHKQLHSMLNKQELVSASVMVDSMVKGIAKLNEREPVQLKMCALFVNEENEDRAAWSADLYTRKIEDWKKEGIAVQDFFALASSSVSGLLESYSAITRAISQTNPDESVLQNLP